MKTPYWRKNPTEKGFTLIELLMAISIITLLAAIIFAALSGARAGAGNASKQEAVRQMLNGLELFYSSNGYYPMPAGGTMTACGVGGSNCGICLQTNSTGSCLFGGTKDTVGDAAFYAAVNPYIKIPLARQDNITGNASTNWGGIAYMCAVTNLASTQCSTFAIEYILSGANSSCGDGKNVTSQWQGTQSTGPGANNVYCLYTSDNIYSTVSGSAYFFWRNFWSY